MSCTIDQLMGICEQALREKWQYVYGAKGQVLSAAQINSLRKTYGSGAVWWSDTNKAGKKCCDCSGLISVATGIVRGSAQYKSTALECYPINKRKSSMRGWAVWMKGHIGVYDGNNGYYAMDGSARNMVHYSLNKNNFTHILKLCDVDYGNGISAPSSVAQPIASGGYYNSPINFYYSVRTSDGKIWPEIVNLSDYAGVRGRKVTDVAIRCDKGALWYQVHVLGGGWLPKVTGCNWNDPQNGFAGDHKVIDAVRVYYNTPADIIHSHGYQKAQYRTSPINGSYYSWQYDNEIGSGQNGYAGCYGIPFDRFQLF